MNKTQNQLVWSRPWPGTYEASWGLTAGFKVNSLGRGKWSVTVTDEDGLQEVYAAGFNLREAKEFAERLAAESRQRGQEELVQKWRAQTEAARAAVDWPEARWESEIRDAF